MIWGEASWPEAEAFRRSAVALLPTGSLEQHGPHLPLLTDTLIAQAFAGAVEARLPEDVLLLPPLWLGGSAHHMAFSGSMTCTPEGWAQAVEAVGDSLVHHGFTKLFLINGHGGNTSMNDLACRRLRQRHPQLLAGHAGWFDFAPEGLWEEVLEGRAKRIRHADEGETSLMLHLHPHLVNMRRAVDDGLEPSVKGISWTFDELTEHGVLGEATLATADKGERIFLACLEGLGQSLKELATGPSLQGR
jgi:creatinine amidohydrolase